MSKAASVSLVAAVACAAFAAGMAVGSGKKRLVEPRAPLAQTLTRTEESDRVNTLLAGLRDLRRDLAYKEQRIQELEKEPQLLARTGQISRADHASYGIGDV